MKPHRTGWLAPLCFAAALLCGDVWAEQAQQHIPENPSHIVLAEREATSGLSVSPEALETLQLIKRGGPFPYRKDGSVFHNRERLLPIRPNAYYREYTVRTPGAQNRGARRLVVGGRPPEVFYYTGDHYRSFTLLEGSP